MVHIFFLPVIETRYRPYLWLKVKTQTARKTVAAAKFLIDDQYSELWQAARLWLHTCYCLKMTHAIKIIHLHNTSH